MTSQLRDDAVAILRSGIGRVDPWAMVEQSVSVVEETLTVATENETVSIDLSRFERIVVVGAGKASASMARGIETVLKERISAGIIAVKPGHTDTLRTIRMIEAGHPVPDDGSVAAAQAIVELVDTADDRTLVLNLVSGGGSALLTLPYRDEHHAVSLEEMQQTTATLLSCGATIQEINCVRKHISSIKGGRFAARCAPARLVSLILSDVVGDDLSSIASGLAAPDATTFADVKSIIRKYGVGDELPRTVLDVIDRGLTGDIADTPKPGDPIFDDVTNVLLGSNAQAVRAAGEHARSLGYNTVTLGAQITGEAREVARVYAGILRDAVRFNPPEPTIGEKPLCVIGGGETTVTLRGDGLGGRNQEMALAVIAEFLPDPSPLQSALFLSGATDGNDGPTDAAGGFADAAAVEAALSGAVDIVDVLQRNDAYHGLETIGALLKTGPTNTNVCDIQIILVR